MDHATDPLQDHATGNTNRRLCILSLDGGGVRGLSALYILKALMARVNAGRESVGSAYAKPYEIFDMIGGTSTGGIIAIMLGRLEMDVEECIAIYQALISKVFKGKESRTGLSFGLKIKPKFSSAVLEAEMRNTINNRQGFSEDDLLDNGKERGCKVLVCATAKETVGIARLKSYTNVGETKPSVSPKIWQAALATSAATQFFDPIKIGTRTYVDGALNVNNPVEEIEQEACDIWYPETGELRNEVACFISIGTGNPGKKPIENGAYKFLSSTLVDIATETEKTAKRFANQWRGLLNERYFRLNVEQGLQDVGLEEFDKEDMIETVTDEYLREAQQVSQLRKIETVLQRKENHVCSPELNLTIWSEQTLDSPARTTRILNRPEWSIALRGLSAGNVFDRISEYEPDRTCREYVRQRCPDTAEWVLENPSFQNWVTGAAHPYLCLTGPIGSGKTLVACTIIERLPTLSHNMFVGHFFYEHSQGTRLYAHDAFRSFIKQMIVYLDAIGRTCNGAVIDAVTRYFGANKPAPSFNEIIDDLFVPLCSCLDASAFIIDGLDVCDQVEIFKVLKAWKKVASVRTLKWLISGRESIERDLRALFGNIPSISISHEANEMDIKTFIDWKIGELGAERELTEDESLLEEVRLQLNTRAHMMILWVSLQLDTLWAQCSTDAAIRRAIMELPQDLDETYNRCLSWIAKTKRYREIAPQILSWICETVAPFKIGELQEALAINTKTGCLEKDRLVPESEIIKSCGNLISCPKNSGRRITVVHHSALLFLRDRFAGDNGLFAHEPTEVEKITPLGNLCVIHLQSPDYTLAVQVHQPASQSMQLNISAITNNPELPAFARWLFRTYAGSDVVIQTVRRPHKLPTKRAESFFDFARKHWAPLTTDLTDDSSIWTMFQELALQPNTSWKMHPWPAHKDIDSHVLGLLGWSIIESHSALMKLVLSIRRSREHADWFNTPLKQFDDLFPLHLAALQGRTQMMRMLLARCKINATNAHQRSLMHYAAQSESSEMILFLYETQIEPREAQDDLGHTPLALAAAEGNETTVSALISLKANTRVSRNDGFIPWQIALQNGHIAVARMFPEWMLSYGESQDPKTEPELGRLAAAGDRPALSMAIASRAQGRLRRNPLMPVVIASREEIVREVLSQDFDGDVGLACVRTALACAAARGKETLVARVLDAGNNGRMTRNEGMYRELSEIADYLVAYMQQD